MGKLRFIIIGEDCYNKNEYITKVFVFVSNNSNYDQRPNFYELAKGNNKIYMAKEKT